MNMRRPRNEAITEATRSHSTVRRSAAQGEMGRKWLGDRLRPSWAGSPPGTGLDMMFQAQIAFEEDVGKVGAQVEALVKVSMTQGQFDALAGTGLGYRLVLLTSGFLS